MNFIFFVLVHSFMGDIIGGLRARHVLEQAICFRPDKTAKLVQDAGQQMRRFFTSSLDFRTREEPGGEHEADPAGKVGRDVVPPPLDCSDNDVGSRVGSLIRQLSTDMHGSGSAGLLFYP